MGLSVINLPTFPTLEQAEFVEIAWTFSYMGFYEVAVDLSLGGALGGDIVVRG
jgi:hypothetical protein